MKDLLPAAGFRKDEVEMLVGPVCCGRRGGACKARPATVLDEALERVFVVAVVAAVETAATGVLGGGTLIGRGVVGDGVEVEMARWLEPPIAGSWFCC